MAQLLDRPTVAHMLDRHGLALHWAAQEGHGDIVAQLLAHFLVVCPAVVLHCALPSVTDGEIVAQLLALFTFVL